MNVYLPELDPARREYTRVEFDGVSFISTPAEAQDFISDSDDSAQYKLTPVWLTPAEFEAIPEFQGF